MLGVVSVTTDRKTDSVRNFLLNRLHISRHCARFIFTTIIVTQFIEIKFFEKKSRKDKHF